MKTLIILMGVALMFAGCAPQYIEVPVIEYVESEPVIVYVDRWLEPEIVEVERVVEKIIEVEKIVTVNQTVEVPVKLKDFETAEELSKFILADRTNEIPSYWTIGGIKVRFWCYNYAETLRAHLHESGYHANIQCFGPSTQLPMSDKVFDEAHAMVTVVVDTDIWLIEPKTDEHWLAWDITEMEIEQ